MKARTPCELCGAEASLHCEADAAFLCWACDAAVHGANFLVARHVRTLACSSCRARRTVSGPSPAPIRSLCPSCAPRRSAAALRRRRTEDCIRRMVRALIGMPLRVRDAAAVRCAIRAVDGRRRRTSGVPGKILVVVESRFGRFAVRIKPGSV